MHEVTIPGPEGRIEGRYNKGPNNNPPSDIIAPAPAHGGNMNNKVIYNCFKTFTSIGFLFSGSTIEELEKVKENILEKKE